MVHEGQVQGSANGVQLAGLEPDAAAIVAVVDCPEDVHGIVTAIAF